MIFGTFLFESRTKLFVLVDMTAKDCFEQEVRKSGGEFDDCGGRWGFDGCIKYDVVENGSVAADASIADSVQQARRVEVLCGNSERDQEMVVS